jgi:glutamine amidotransferase
MVKVAVVDYGIGNLRSVRRSLEEAGAQVLVTGEEEEIRAADALVLPGVGSFAGAIEHLKPLSGVILEQVRAEKPLLGICLGLQLLFTHSTEGGYHRGLDVFKGSIIKLPQNVKIPHMGWNTLKDVKPDHPLLRDVPDGTYVYFVHSYYADMDCEEQAISRTHYGLDFPSVVAKGSVFATQFHPEKSGKTGLKIVQNFVEFIKSYGAGVPRVN